MCILLLQSSVCAEHTPPFSAAFYTLSKDYSPAIKNEFSACMSFLGFNYKYAAFAHLYCCYYIYILIFIYVYLINVPIWWRKLIENVLECFYHCGRF